VKNHFYNKAGNIYRKIKDGKIEDLPPEGLLSLSIKLGRCYYRTKQYEDAIGIFEELDKQHTDNITIKTELADAYLDAANNIVNDDKKKIEYLKKAAMLWRWLGQHLEKFSEGWWNIRYKIVLTDYERGSYKEAYDAIITLETTVNKNFDDNKWGFKDKFLKLKKQLQEKLPK
jgi:tetratricopeptide (TPR) repeat protein